MIRKPWKFASEENEQYTKLEDYENIMSYIEKYYPELIHIDNLYQRLAIYDMIYFLKQYVNAPQYEELKDDVLSGAKKVVLEDIKSPEIYNLMNQVNNWIKEILKDNYVGVYFHGSLRFGSFNPNKSDLDFIIVVKNIIDSKTKELIFDKMLENEHLFPKKGFEFSVVLAENCFNIKHPVPYELHGSESWIEKYKSDKSLVINDDYKVDPDLASHFNVINIPNESMDFGKSSKEVFAKVPKEYIIDFNYQDTLDCVEEITNNPTYCVLNLCRFYALIRDDLTLSKYDGGKWALENMNSSYNDIIKLAMEDYMSDTNNTYDNEKLKEFAKETIGYINSCLSTNYKSK